MSFLAIFNSTQQVMQDNRAVTCSLVSTLASTISIVIGLLHVRVSETNAQCIILVAILIIIQETQSLSSVYLVISSLA